jgi:hypothetical protein
MFNQSNRRFGSFPLRERRNAKGKSRSTRLSIEALEVRDLLHAAAIDRTTFAALPAAYQSPAALVSTVTTGDQSQARLGESAGSSSFGSGATLVSTALISAPTKLKQWIDPKTADQQMGLPLLDSLSGAPTTLYLDFNGDFESDWWTINDNGQQTHYRNFSTPVFDTDGNTSSFGTAEQSLIKEIWARVAEDYAPFNINVSTDYYGSFNNGQAVHVVIGGSNSTWLQQDASGISSIGSFNDTAPNTVFVFDLMTWASAGVRDGDGRVMDGPSAIATTASHEAGHSFGLRHQALYRVDGSKITDYNPGSSGNTPIMGDNKASDRTTWWAGTTDRGPNTWQDDMAVLGRTIGFRADDHGNSTATADPMLTNYDASTLSNKGIVNSTSDWDFFKFTTGGGSFQITVNPAKFGPNLVPIAELWSANRWVASADAGGMAQSIIHANVPAGTYYVLVKGWVDDGDVGQYTVSVSFQPVYVMMATTSTLMTTDTGSSSTTPISTTPQLQSTSLSGASLSSASAGAGQLANPPADMNPKIPAATKTAAELHDMVFELDDFLAELERVPGRLR